MTTCRLNSTNSVEYYKMFVWVKNIVVIGRIGMFWIYIIYGLLNLWLCEDIIAYATFL